MALIRDTAVRATEALGAVPASYAQLLFSRSRVVGAIVLAATMMVPRVGLSGVAAVSLALVTARAFRLAPESIESGQYSYSALLVGLGAGTLVPAGGPVVAWIFVAIAIVASVLLSASLSSALDTTFALPVLTLPFLAAYYALLAALPHDPIVAHNVWPAQPLAWPGPLPVRAFLSALGALLFLPRVDVGALLLVALAFHSRIAVFLAVLGFAVVSPFAAQQASIALGMGLNAMLVAIAIGGVWFVPSLSAYALALAAVLLCTLFDVALASRLGAALPVLIVPFNLTVLMVLYAARQRVANGMPHRVDFVPGTPEANLAYFRSRTERFGAMSGLRFRAPFRGRWTCSQGVSGGLTHEGAWRHALDFEVVGEDGRAFRDTGAQPADYHCYRLPVVAPAAGVVARIIDGIKDNPIGDLDTQDNWGNAVILYHAPGLYSCLAHFSPGSFAVREGQNVRAGDVLGLCGNSGRSATPHLHLQFQGTSKLGAPTVSIALHDVVVSHPRGLALHAVFVPTKGDTLRPIEADADRASMLRFPYERVLRVRVTEPSGAARFESFVPDVDLLGRFRLRSTTADATLYYEINASDFTVHDVVGRSDSVLHLLRVALSRVPFDTDDTLTWTDRLPLRAFLPVWSRPLFDLVAPFGFRAALEMTYSSRRRGESLIVEGSSVERLADGRPLVSSTAHLAAGAALVRLTVRIRAREYVIEPAPLLHRSSVPEALTGGIAHAQRP